jgi:hypothetical protein
MTSLQADQPQEGLHDADDQAENRAKAWLQARARLQSDLLRHAPPWVQGVFEHAWAPMQALARQIRCLPTGLWKYLLGCPGGFVVISAEESRYVPGPVTVRHRRVQNVAFVSIADLADKNERPLHATGHLIDHHLGCGGQAEGAWLSEGGGVTARWQEAGARLQRLFALGYAVDEIAQSDVQNYFAQSLALYCHDRQRLNVADPQIYKWLRSTLWSEAFWQAGRQARNER